MGVGIPADALPQVFDRFYRADSARSLSQDGAWLGLSLVK
jgi:signal transduction histidine kinase